MYVKRWIRNQEVSEKQNRDDGVYIRYGRIEFYRYVCTKNSNHAYWYEQVIWGPWQLMGYH